MTNPYFCWEQRAFLVINTPFGLVGTLAYLILNPVYGLMQLLVFPLMALLFVMNITWLLLFGIITGLSKVSRSVPTARPISFALALPFLLVAHFLVSISPVPTPTDVESKVLKWKFVELFPYCHFAQYGSE